MTSNPWGAPVTATAAPVKLHDVMDEELAAKLQREEEEEWEREIAAQFGDRSTGWCFVEVPSTDSNEYGVMSVVQQEVPMEEQNGDPNDPDYAFALELQAQEAEEYDRLRRQEASSIERIQVMQQDPQPKPVQAVQPRRQLRDFLGSGRSRRSLQRYQSASSPGEFAVHIEEEYEYDSTDDDTSNAVHHIHHVGGDYRDANATPAQEDEEEDMFLEDDLPIAKFNELDITPRRSERKYRQSPIVATTSSTHTPPPSHHRNQYNRSYLATETE